MESIPNYVSVTFIICIVVTLGFLHYAITIAAATKRNLIPIIIITAILSWFLIISFAEYNEFFNDFDSKPPKLVIAAVFIGFVILGVFSFRKSRAYIQKMPLATLTYVHIIRIPVENVLWWLFLGGLVPAEITFEGMNYDIVIGITAPFAALFMMGKKSKSKIGLGLWHILGLIFLANVVLRAVMTTPYFNDLGMIDTLNMAIFYFPYIFLPLFIVPVVFFSHIASLYILFTSPSE